MTDTGTATPAPAAADAPTLQGTVVPRERAARPLAEGTRIGHVHMRAGDLAKIRSFYVDILGFDVVFDAPGMLFVAAGGYHHHLGFNTWESKGGSPPPAGTTGLYHIAILYPTRAALGDALRRLAEARWPIDGYNDHGTHEAIYLRDPEENGLELAWDRPREEWDRDPDGHLALGNRRLDLAGLLKEGL